MKILRSLLFLFPFCLCAWSIHVGPIKNGGNCSTIVVNVSGYLDGIQDAPHLVFHQGSSIAPLSLWPSATGSDFSGQDTPGHPVSFFVHVDNAGPSGNLSYTDPSTFPSGGDITGTLAGGVGSCSTNDCLSTNYVYSFTVNNQGNAPAYYWISLDGARQCGFMSVGGGQNMGMMVGPGQSATLSTAPIPIGCGSGNDGNYTIQQVDPTGAWNDCGGSGSNPNGPGVGPSSGPSTITPTTGPGGAGGGTIVTGGGTGGGGGGSGSGTGGTTYQPTNGSPIVWNPTNSPGTNAAPTDGTLQEGFAALYDAINRNGAATVSGIAQVFNEQLNQRGVMQGTTNLLGQNMVAMNNGFGNTTNLLIQQTNLATKMLLNISNELAFNTNAFNNLSNAVFSGGMITNFLGQEISSNLVNTRTLSNSLYGLSNAVVNTGTNQGLFMSNAFYSVMSGLTNIGGIGSNSFSDGGMTNSINRGFANESNQLTGIGNSLSNLLYFGTNGGYGASNAIVGMIPGSGTNSSVAIAAGTAAAGDATAAADGAVSAIGSAPVPGDGSMPALTVAFIGGSLDLSPEHIAPGISVALKAMITAIVLIAFALSTGKLFWEATQTYAAAQTGGVPDMDAAGEILGTGFGGNIIGVAVAAIIPVVFIAIWVALFTAFFGLITSRLSQLSGSTFNLPNSTAMSMLTAVFPLNLMLALVWTRITLFFAAGKLVIIAASASRYLFGK